MTDKPEPPEEIYVQHFDGVFVHQPPRERDELCADDNELSYYCDRNNFVKYIRADVVEKNIIRDYLNEVYGPRCEEFQPGCMTCNAWASYDDYKSDRALTELTQSSQDMGMYDHIGQVDKMISLEELKKETSQEP